MFDGLRGTKWGTKVANTVIRSTENILNCVAHKAPFTLSLEDKYIILREVFAGCWSISLFLGINKSVSQYMVGAALIQASRVTCDWYSAIFKADSETKPSSEDMDALGEQVPDDLKRFCEVWIRQLKNDHSDSIGMGIEHWIPAIISKATIGIEYHLSETLRLNLGNSFAGVVAGQLCDAAIELSP